MLCLVNYLYVLVPWVSVLLMSGMVFLFVSLVLFMSRAHMPLWFSIFMVLVAWCSYLLQFMRVRPFG